MSDSLRDQLMGLGFQPPKPAKPPRKADGRRGKDDARARGKAGGRQDRTGRPAKGKGGGGPQPGGKGARGGGDIDLAKAFAIRAQREKDERIEAERRKQEEARKRREARAKLATLLEGKALNAEEADIARHFEYGGKIKRVYVTADQLKALNAGELGVLQHNGRYLLVTAALLAEAEAVFAPAVALKVDPGAPAEENPYADPRFEVPDDLVW